MSPTPPIKPYKKFIVVLAEVPVDSEGTDVDHILPRAHATIEANGNPELYAKTGQFVRQFSEDNIPEWRKKL